MNRHFTLSKALTAILFFIGIALRQSAFAQTTWTLQPSFSGNTITYKVKRSGDISQAVTVRYRTVGLSSYEGENFTSANGTLTFPAGIDEKTVTVTSQTPSTEAYKYYQSGATRKYLFEVTDMGGFSLVSKEDNAGAGTVFNTSYLNQSVTDLVYFTYNGAIQSGDGNKYVDASHSGSSDWVQVTDGGYDQAVHTISTNSLYNNNSTSNSFRSYLNEIGYNMYATVYFTQKEEQDGYQYIQILADNSSTYDGDDPDGAVNAPSTSIYKASFILSYDPSGSVMSDPHYQFFPHRYDYIDRAAEQTAGISHYEFDYDNSHLYQQRFKATSYQSNTSGSLVLAPTVNNLNVRFDAAGSGGDTWDFKNLKVRLALVDATKPTIRNNNDIRVADGAYGYGNTVYITIPFTEIVTVTGNPTLSTTWGTLNYIAGSGTNVLTFSGNIQADLGTVLTVNSIGGTSFTIKDLMGNAYNNTSINKTFNGLQVTNPWTGSGTANDPYIIMDRYQLDLLSRLVWSGQLFANTYFKLGADISYTHSSSDTWDKTSSFTSNFTSIGGWGNSFRGIFDGDGHSISGIRIYKNGTANVDECQGLFGMTYSGSMVKNLVLYDINIVGKNQVGVLVGSAGGTIQDCYIYNARAQAANGSSCGIINGSGTSTITRAYYKDCMIGSNTGQHNIGKLTLNDGATISRTSVTTLNANVTLYGDGATINGAEYYTSGTTVTLSYNGSVPSGSFVKYTATTNGGDITYSNINGNVLTMPDADVTVSAAILPVVDYLDADGNAQQCSDYTLITSSNSNVEMGASGKTHWYVVSSDATINAMLKFTDATANLILCNGATLNVNRTNSGSAVFANNLNIFGQTNGNGTLNATVSNGSGISSNALGIYGGIVSASGGDYGINAGGNSITLGYTAAANRVTASSYLCNSLTVKAGQTLTDGEGHLYNGTYTGDGLDATLAALAGKTLQPAYSLTLPDHFTVTGTTAPQGFAPANEMVTIHTAEGYTITSASYTPAGGSATTITPVEGVWSFTMPAANTTVSATRVVNTYTVHFDANATNGINVTGTMEDMDFTYGQAQNLTTNDFERTGYTFDGWNTAADGTGTAYTNQQSVSNLTNVLNGVVTLYAQWSVINWTGNGTSENDPYLIIYASQLVKLSDDVNDGTNNYFGKFFKLGNDIDMNGVAFDGIGNFDYSFQGTFNGDGKTISNVTVDKGSLVNHVGFFGSVINGTIANLILDGASITGYRTVGVLVGWALEIGNIENCLVMNSNATNNNNNETGVICGFYDNSNFTNNHYRNCTITNINDTYTTNIGTTNGDVAGARSVHTLALPEHVTASSTDMVTYDNVTYYASNVEVTLTSAQGITLADVTVNGVAATHQQDETWTFTMPATDATVTASASVPYIDADGNLQTCTDFTIIESSESDVSLGTSGQDEWYVVSGDVTINGQVTLRGSSNHIILCDGATLTTTHTSFKSIYAYDGSLTIYRQSLGSGAIVANGSQGIYAETGLTIHGGNIDLTTSGTSIYVYTNDLTINGGTINVISTGNDAICTYDENSHVIINGGIVNAVASGPNKGIWSYGGITLGYTDLSDRITVSSYTYRGSVGFNVKDGQFLTDGTAVYSGSLDWDDASAMAGQTLQPCFSITLPEHVNATGVISQTGTTAYALAGAEITLAAAEGYEITGGTTSFTMPAQDVVSDVTVQIITYNITYDLAGGNVATANPVTYTVETPTFTLNNPTREHFTFAGWIGTGFSDPTTTVTIEQGSTGDREYYANWTPNLSEFWGNGDGSQEYPYIITDTIGLNMLATLVNEGYDLGDNKTYFELGANIQYDNTVDNNFKPIGHGEGGDHSFSEVFDGKGYTISGIRVSNSTALQGVFGWSWGGTVRNVILTDAIFSGGEYYAGGIVGNNKGTVENCLVIDVTVSGNEYQGAVVGFNDQGTVTNSYYHNCTVGSESNLSNAYIVTFGDYVTASIEYYSAGIEYDGTLYAPVDAIVSLDLAYSGTIPEGYRLAYYTVNNEPIDGDTFEMPAADVVIEAVLLEHYYTYNSTTGELALIYGEFNKDNKWGNDVTPSAVTSVTATNEVSFTGDCYHLFFGFRNCTSMDLKNVNTEGVTNMACMFDDCSSLITLDLSGWNTRAVTIMDYLFNSCTKLKTLDLTGWDVSHVISMPVVFHNCQSLTTIQGIKQWNPSHVTDMNAMFKYCKSLKSLDLSGWNTESLTEMDVMFMECDSIQTLNLSGWDVSHVANMDGLFWGCKSLETLDVSGWDMSNVTDMGSMFFNCSSLTTLHRSEWNTEKVTDMGNMFYLCSSLTTLDLSDWNTENVTDMWSMFTYCSNLATIYAGEGWSVESAASAGGGMFYDCTSLVGDMGTTYDPNHIDGDYAHIDGGPDNPGYLSRLRYFFNSTTGELALIYGEFNKDNKWGADVPIAEVTSVTATDEVSFTGDCSDMFHYFTSCTSIDLSQVKTDDCTNMSYMFGSCLALTTLDVSNFNTANVTDMSYMFASCNSLESLDLSYFNTASVTNMLGMFVTCTSLESLDVSNWYTANVTNMNNMFLGCWALESLDLSNFNTDAVTNMINMFLSCRSLESLDVSGWNTASVTNMGSMFNGCSNLTTLDLSSWSTAAVTDIATMFIGCSNLTTIYVGSEWNAENITNSGGMFYGCTNLVGGNGTTYDENHIDGEYARIDRPGRPGYLSAIPLDPVEYIDADGNTQTCTNYTLLKGSNYYSSYGEYDVEAWYVVDHDVTYSDGLQFNGSANLILVDGATLTINDDTEGNGGYMSSSDRLTIYVQSNGTGAITAVNSSISASGDLIIHGGHITLSSDNSQAVLWSWGDLTINGGEISIENSNYSCIYTYGLLTVNDGTLNAVVTGEDNGYDVIYSEEDVVINGGNITVTNQGYGRGIVGDNVTINGGSVKVYIAHEDDYSGIATDWWGGITLGWTDASDLIMSQGGYKTDQLSIATGQAFTDGEGNYYFGTYYLYEMPDLAGKTLVPFTNLDETFHITYVTNGGTLPDGYPTTYTFGETVVLPIPTKEDNAFAGWFDNAEFEGYFITEIEAGTALGNKTFYARWKPEYTDVTYLDADGQTQTVRAKVLYGIETELPGGVYTIVDDDVYFDKLSFTGNTTIILPDYKRLFVEAWGKGTNDDENGLFVNGDLTIYGQEFGDGLLNSFNVQVSGDVAIYGGHLDIGILSANNGSGTITLSWTGWDSSIRVGVYLGKVVLAKAFIDDDDNIHEAGPVEDVTTINGQWLYPCITETEVSYLDQNGVLQTVTATVLYGGEEAEYPGGVYTVLDMVIRGQAYYDRLHFTGD
ncbi:MAG: BspA family leucine-rich repeat surface protein, partial [Bacteroidales bacterium]|nr:BspA family leucine-rich repeat surface protein [Bacteroidales bacterium]